MKIHICLKNKSHFVHNLSTIAILVVALPKMLAKSWQIKRECLSHGAKLYLRFALLLVPNLKQGSPESAFYLFCARLRIFAFIS